MIGFRIVPLGVNAKQPASPGAKTSSNVVLKVETRALKLRVLGFITPSV
jgi:hypothetical protein